MDIKRNELPLPESLLPSLQDVTGAIYGHESVGGGCIAHATRLETEQGLFFLKWGTSTVSLPFEAEAAGLEALRRAGSSLVIPSVIACEQARHGYLLLEWVEPGAVQAHTWEAFGRGLAALHRRVEQLYGFPIDNFIGQAPQENAWLDSWPAFFRTRRLEPQVIKARQASRWKAEWDSLLESLYGRLDSVLPAQPPASLLHGDLWSGNFIVTETGNVALIDPAAYFGHREADLAMTELFGGFEDAFYDAYRESWPLKAGYTERRDIYNLYHLINHLNHFGWGYGRGVEQILKRYG